MKPEMPQRLLVPGETQCIPPETLVLKRSLLMFFEGQLLARHCVGGPMFMISCGFHNSEHTVQMRRPRLTAAAARAYVYSLG